MDIRNNNELSQQTEDLNTPKNCLKLGKERVKVRKRGTSTTIVETAISYNMFLIKVLYNTLIQKVQHKSIHYENMQHRKIQHIRI